MAARAEEQELKKPEFQPDLDSNPEQALAGANILYCDVWQSRRIGMTARIPGAIQSTGGPGNQRSSEEPLPSSRRAMISS